MEAIKTTASLCMRCLQFIMTEEIKKDNDHEFQFVEGCCQNCEDLGMVTSIYAIHKDKRKYVSKSPELSSEYLIMRKAYQ